MDYYRKQLKENKIVNKKLLSKFEGYLSSIDFPETEISKNVFNAAFFINIYLTKDEIISAVKGYQEIHKFTDFFLKEADIWRKDVWEIIKKRQDVKFFILTKRPERVINCLPSWWNDGLDNAFSNVTRENQKRADENT